MSRTRLTVFASPLAALVLTATLVVSGCGTADEPSDPSPVSRASTSTGTSSGTSSGAGDPTGDPGPGNTQSEDPAPERELGAPGIPACDLLDLPATALPVIEDIEAGGPYDHPRNDGVRFQNREEILPEEDRDYYREFTVETPGLDHRGPRRIVTGGFAETDPERWYFTDDHYESFCEFDPDLTVTE